MNSFWVDRDLDCGSASDGISRYGAYVRDRIRGGFDECWDGTWETRLAERFADLAWRTATGPVMSPPYASWRSPVLSARTGLDADGGGLIATVELASPCPRSLNCGRAGDRLWRSWPREHSCGGDEDFVRDPYGDEVTRGGCYALASLRLVFLVPAALLPSPPGARHRNGDVEETARRAVDALAAEFNRTVDPVTVALGRL